MARNLYRTRTVAEPNGPRNRGAVDEDYYGSGNYIAGAGAGWAALFALYLLFMAAGSLPNSPPALSPPGRSRRFR